MAGVKLNWDGDKAIGIVNAQGERGLRECAQFILDESRKYVPIDTGALSRSGAVDVQGLQATVSYDTPYAVEQHENRKFRHQRDRKAKYLEDVVNDVGIRADIMKYIQKNIRL